MKKSKGIGLLELMLSLSIIAILLLLVTRYYLVTHLSEQVNAGVEMVQQIKGASEKWLMVHDTYLNMDLQNLVDIAALPESFDQSKTPKNPWGGDVRIAGTDTEMRISFADIPQNACENLKGKLQTLLVCPNDKQECSDAAPTTYIITLERSCQ